MRSSPEALALIVTEEVSDAAYYTRHYQGFDWPQGASGPTVGIGYDCGYVTPAEARADWAGILPPEMIEIIVRACGIKGEAAHGFVEGRAGKGFIVTYGQAMAEFQTRELPKWEARVAADLPNTELLPADCFGAIVSIAYNRGASFDLPGPRFAEMRAIKAHMAAKEFGKIPAEILQMRRLWPAGGDLWRRRGHEAALFLRGLNPPAAVPVTA